MAQKQIQIQEQKQLQVQRLSQQQMLQVKLLEMPLTELEESVNAELDDNPALEKGQDEGELNEIPDSSEANNDDFEAQQEQQERQDALDKALERMGGDDELPVYDGRQRHDNADYEEIVYGDTTSFIDKLNEQVGERELSERQKTILEYLIGSLDDDGLLRKELDVIADELAIYQGIDCDEKEISDTLQLLQDFDPAGIGARSLQECLLLQIKRKVTEGEWERDSNIYGYLKTIFTEYFDAFTKKHWDKIQAALSLSDLQIKALQAEIRKLNPKPGASMGETMGRNVQQITPDFIIDTDDNGNISFTLNHGNLPELHVSQSFNDMLAAYKDNKQGMNRQEKEALLYAKGKVEKAQGFIEAIKQRRNTLYTTMKAIIEIQKKFFQEGNEADLKPMILKDIAEKTGLDISTISRVSNIKYAQTRWGTFPLRFFFTDSYTTEDGEEMSTRKIKVALREIIDNENKQKPLSDDALAKVMKEKGFPIARRTVAKYREQLNLPVARLRKE
ncbi:RNA polymerase factor sigma-54 [Prevotella aurantiaca]|jgi:RNA polymerase sigma-54 factor|uniref:RNA polymerase factor sigma-54 n=1 Tax=Prevotella aurantiaca TaxID=596085 RepID=A0A930HLE1_9BACT|nr:RNA polymerase factor sigma-54 [Prevotella aurantiaca]MBF1383954.1 RNA polymerase factor sigma-54 [Prevotella aurantiaca]